MSDPFLIEGPACVSFSGGRTSGYMLWRILQAHGGTLPEDVRVVFANTGKEMGETLDFVQECSRRWAVGIHWVEFRNLDGEHTWREVTYGDASRNGEPYEELIRKRNYLPNPVARFCTTELKIRPMTKFCRDHFGWTEYDCAIGIRADEPRRIAKLKSGTQEAAGIRFNRISPLAEAGVAVAEVGEFWSQQPFDLRLPNMNGKTMHGNCDLCFLKGADQVLALIREEPKRAVWWVKMEALALASKPDGAVFRKDRPSYKQMHDMATKHGELFAFDDEPLQDCMCTD